MTGKNSLFDSNIIIYLSKRELPLSFIDDFEDIFISVITYMEILGYNFENKKEESFIKDLLSIFRIIYIDHIIANLVIDIRRNHSIKLPDAIISATATTKDLHLVTRNVDDFKNINTSIINPFDS